MTAGIGTTGIGQVGDRGLVEEHPRVIPGTQGGRGITFKSVGHAYDTILVAKVGRCYAYVAAAAVGGGRRRSDMRPVVAGHGTGHGIKVRIGLPDGIPWRHAVTVSRA